VPGTRPQAEQELIAFVRSGYALWNSGDLERVADMWSEDVEWHNAPEWPGQRVYHGRAEIVEFLRSEVTNVIELDDIDVTDVEVHGNELLIRLAAHTRGHDSRVDIGKIPVFHVARVENGQVVRIRAFLDEAQAVEAARSAG
jgi:ketosteroid isomerase-like protein